MLLLPNLGSAEPNLLPQVENQTEQLLARAPLVCYAVVYPTGERRMACEVADVRWWLLTTTPSLKVAPLTYMVAMPGERVFYSVTFAEDTPPEVRCVHSSSSSSSAHFVAFAAL